MARANDEDNLKVLYQELMPALAKAAVGDFRSDLEIGASNDPKINEILMGVQILLDVINEKMEQLEGANSKSPVPDRGLTLFD